MGSPGRPPWLSHSPWALVVPCSLLLYVHRDHKDSQGWGAQDCHLDFHTAPELWWFLVHCCFMSIETIRTIRDGEPRLPPWLSHSPWALVVPCSLLLYVHRDHKDYQGWGAQDCHLDFHTAPELWWFLVHCCFMSIETIRTIRDGEPRTATLTFTQPLSSGGSLFTVALCP